MAADLASTPDSGIVVQACGDAHISNFGGFAAQDRRLVFGPNDFDETLPGPWEWDVKRLAASFVVAGRCYQMSESTCTDVVRACARSYREKMRGYSRMRLLDIWYSRVDAEAILKVFGHGGRRGIAKDLDKARQRNSLQALSRLAALSEGCLRIVENPPLVSHVHDKGLSEFLRRMTRGYHISLQDDRRTLLERYRFVDLALKVVGVGSVGTRCYIMLFDGSHHDDPLFLQIKEAQASVLEPYAGKCRHHNHGQRVVSGQRLVQSASDIFLGWSSEGGHDYYVRQLRDMKGTADLAGMTGADLVDYAELCGWVLARAHARSGDPVLLAGYLGKGDAFDNALAAFATAYADQTEQDYETFKAAVKAGRIAAEEGV